MNLRSLDLTAIKHIWRTSRYLRATVATALALGVVPVLLATVFTVIGGLCIIAYSLLLLGSVIAGAASPPGLALLLTVGLPIGFAVVVIVLFDAIIVGVMLFVGLAVLPIALITEAALQAEDVTAVPSRLVAFLGAGGLCGAVGAAAAIHAHAQADAWVLLVTGLFTFLTVALPVGLFGVALTLAETTASALSES